MDDLRLALKHLLTSLCRLAGEVLGRAVRPFLAWGVQPDEQEPTRTYRCKPELPRLHTRNGRE